jgi:hypothetical protein
VPIRRNCGFVTAAGLPQLAVWLRGTVAAPATPLARSVSSSWTTDVQVDAVEHVADLDRGLTQAVHPGVPLCLGVRPAQGSR